MSAHELLPWYVNKSLEPDELAQFEAHLAGCEACTREIDLVEGLHDQLREARPGAMPDHPQPASLLALVSPDEADVELTRDDADTVRRHLALCFACRQELDWLQGRAVAGGAARSFYEVFSGRGSRLLGTGLAAAALVVLGSLLIARLASGPESVSGTTRPQIVPSIRRAEAPSVTVSAKPGTYHLMLLFEVDLGPDDFPARLTVTAESGEGVVPPVKIEPDDLFRGAYVTFLCDLSDCLPGQYVAAIQPRDGRRPATQYPFRVVKPEPPVR